MVLALTHAKFQLLELFRIPIAVIGGAFWPAAAMLAFVVPFTGDDPAGATYAAASMITFAVMSTNLFQYGIGVAEDRAQPWDPYVRTLPAGALPRFTGRIVAGLTNMAISMIPVVIIAALFTPASVSGPEFLAAAAATAVISVPFILLGLSIGYSMPQKAAIVVAQVLFLPLAFGGGLMGSPGWQPGFVATIAPYLPTGGAVRLMWAAVGDYPFQWASAVSLLAWTVALGGLAVLAFRRDEGRRFG
ncbi:ABC transporter [Actinoplanes ianthinogenes]|uniref:ABC transporter n=1 Tax=Actinoplanes ianthinogenes TaxID=122358 RepID=A0ABM7LXA0_9ACTN|nr:ABC transporter permease [Actinoplanes ianthinogenes]BCJ43848.1 ABC transporter [Actinoplanes ianthinogenes]GGR38761.1 ABC transporter [Actinoplanes ianthinogenes]